MAPSLSITIEHTFRPDSRTQRDAWHTSCGVCSSAIHADTSVALHNCSPLVGAGVGGNVTANVGAGVGGGVQFSGALPIHVPPSQKSGPLHA